MSLSVPQLDIYYIDLEKDEGFLKKIAKSISGLIDNNRFHIIRSEEELDSYENVNGNSWVTNDKSFKKRQYYIRHPKKDKQNILIETKDFYNYIEDEQKDELVNFIMSHCSASVIRIERTEMVAADGKAKGNVEGVDVSGSATYNQARKYYYERIDSSGIPMVNPRENYYWLDKSMMHTIESLTGGTYTDSIERDFTFGLSAEAANTVGLDMNMHKKFSYTIHIECYDNKIEDLEKKNEELLAYQKKAKRNFILASILEGLGIITAIALAIIL